VSRCGWVHPSFFESPEPGAWLTVHSAPRLVDGRPVDVPVVVKRVEPEPAQPARVREEREGAD
jgi:hypothetical protein